MIKWTLSSFSSFVISLYHFRAEQKESKKVEKQAKALEAESAAKPKDKESEKEKPKEEAQKDKEQKAKDTPKEKETKAKDLVKEDDKKEESQPTPLSVKPAQNWCDFFFIIDSLSYNIDMCDFILFMTKLHPTLPNIDTKKVNVDASYLETGSNTLVFSYTEAGIMETLLGKFPNSANHNIVFWSRDKMLTNQKVTLGNYFYLSNSAQS